MKRFLSALPVLLLAGAGFAQAVTLVRSDFDTGAEGWNAFNGVSERQWFATGGQAGGYIQATDGAANMIWAFRAPAAYLGDQSAALGGSLSFWLRTSTLGVPMEVPWADVKIGGDGLVLAIDAGPSPGLDWTPYSVAFVPGAWRLGEYDGPVATGDDLSRVLANLEFLHIRGEFSGLLDSGSLDSVVLSAVPEPPAALLALAGAALLLVRHRR